MLLTTLNESQAVRGRLFFSSSVFSSDSFCSFKVSNSQPKEETRPPVAIYSLHYSENHIACIETELVVSNDVLKKIVGELATVKIANDRFQVIAQSATLDAHIFKEIC